MSRFLTAARKVLSFLWSSLRAAHTLVFGLLSVGLIAGLVFIIADRDTPEIPDGGALALNITGTLVEQKTALDFSTVLQGQSIPNETLVRDVAMHIAAAAPRFLSRDEVTEQDLAEEREIAREQAIQAGKPEQIVEKIVEGKLNKYYSLHCLFDQAYVKDPDKTVGALLNEAIGRIGENIQVQRFTRYVLGEGN